MKNFLIFILTTILVCMSMYFLLKKDDTSTSNLNSVNTNMDFDKLNIETVIEGIGEEAKNGDTLVVNYIGTLKNGSKFDSSYDRNQPFEFVLGSESVIEGWERGMLGMKRGEKRKLEIPSSMGYGNYVTGSIPANSGLIFEVELLEIK